MGPLSFARQRLLLTTPDASFHMVPLLTNKVPPEGTLRRCLHGIYAPSWVNGVNYYCQMCNPSREIPNAQSVILPRSSNDALSHEGRSTANKHGSGCPQCGSAIWLRAAENGSDTHRVCAECEYRYKVRQSFHQLAMQLEREMHAE